MTKPEFEKLLQRYLRGECTEEEKVRIQIWFDKIEKERGCDLSEEQKGQLEEVLLSRIDDKIEEKNKAKTFKVRLNSLAIYGSIAASLILTIFLVKCNWLFVQKLVIEDKKFEYKTITQTNTTGLRKPIMLEDSTVVYLTQGSSISHKDHFEKRYRQVTLKGAGFFHVSKDPRRPFYVFCNKTITKVIGTSFWVNSNSKSKSVEIGVKTGKVSVMINDNAVSKKVEGQISGEVFLTPNQRVVFFEKQKRIEKTLVPEPVVLETKEVTKFKFVYQDTPLVKVLQELGQSYNVQILMLNEKLKYCSFTGDLTAMSFQEKFDLICESVGSKYTIQGTNIVLTGSGFKNSH